MLHIMVDMPDLIKIEKDLNMTKDKVPHILRTAINNTAKRARPMLVEGVTKEFHVQRKAHVSKTMDIAKATVSKLEAVITSKGRDNELYDFRIKPKAYIPHPWDRPKAGHTANVRKSNQPNYVRKHEMHPGSKVDNYKGFTVKFGNGHISIAQRVPGELNAKGREKIKNLYTISIPSMLKETLGDDYKNITYNSVSEKIQEELIDQIQKQMVRYLK